MFYINPIKVGFRGGFINGLKVKKWGNVIFCSKKGDYVG
jgi:hypothetical protein